MNMFNILKWMKSTAFMLMMLCMGGSVNAAMQVLDDHLLGEEVGQAAFFTQYQAPSASGTGASATDFGFFTVGVNASIALNANIKSLQLGCGGVNGAGGCDINGQNVSFGCAADSGGNCITQGSGATATQMKDFTLDNPFLQLAIKNPNSLSTRSIAGFRLGAGQVTGPLSFGNLISFSGYLSAKANISLLGNGTSAGQDGFDVGITCKYPAGCLKPGADTTDMVNNGASSYGSPSVCISTFLGFCTGSRGGQSDAAGGYLNLKDDLVLSLLGINVRFQQLTANYQTVTRNNNSVVASGNRQTQAFISGVALGGVVNSLTYGNTDGSTTVGGGTQGGTGGNVPLTINRTDSGGLVSPGLANFLLPLLRDGVGSQIKSQLAQGLLIYDPNPATNQTILDGKSVMQVNDDLNNFQIPYNISNLHQADINSSLFGLSLQNTDVQYPGYVQAVKKGWALYVPNAFTLNIAAPTTTFVSNIVGSNAAANGNIIGLPAVYQNCYGTTLKFC